MLVPLLCTLIVAQFAVLGFFAWQHEQPSRALTHADVHTQYRHVQWASWQMEQFMYQAFSEVAGVEKRDVGRSGQSAGDSCGAPGVEMHRRWSFYLPVGLDDKKRQQLIDSLYGATSPSFFFGASVGYHKEGDQDDNRERQRSELVWKAYFDSNLPHWRVTHDVKVEAGKEHGTRPTLTTSVTVTVDAIYR